MAPSKKVGHWIPLNRFCPFLVRCPLASVVHAFRSDTTPSQSSRVLRLRFRFDKENWEGGEKARGGQDGFQRTVTACQWNLIRQELQNANRDAQESVYDKCSLLRHVCQQHIQLMCLLSLRNGKGIDQSRMFVPQIERIRNKPQTKRHIGAHQVV